MKKILFTLLTLAAGLLSSCDEHKFDAENVGVQPRHVLCSDGKTHTLSECRLLGKTPVAAVFYINTEGKTDGIGYAVYLWDIPSGAFSEATGVKQNTSADVEAYDGESNTYQLYSAKAAASPIAESVFSLLPHGQQAFVPSVAEMRLLFEAKELVNPIITECGGDPIKGGWYWTSTEVQGQETTSAWLYSMESGLYLSTPKSLPHSVRPIVTLRY